MTSDPYSNRHAAQRTIADADQAELTAVGRGSAVVDAGVYDERVAGALDDFDPGEELAGPDWHREDLRYDSAVGRIQEEVYRRSRMMGDAYPFNLKKNEIEYCPSKSGCYEFCLATCCSPSITKGEFVGLPRTFERLSALLVQRFLGSGAESLHVGKPRDAAVGAQFYTAMRRLHEITGEWLWQPEDGLPQKPTTTGDEGVDFVVWKRALDKRLGHLFILGQSACGDDWIGKFRDLDLERLGKWFHPLSYVEPVRSFTTPFHLSDGHLPEAQRKAGLVFDRARLALLAEGMVGDPAYASWPARLRDLTTLVVVPAPAAAR